MLRLGHPGPQGRRQGPARWQLQPGGPVHQQLAGVKLLSGEDFPCDISSLDVSENRDNSDNDNTNDNDSVSDNDSESDIDSDDEVEPDTNPAVLVPSQQQLPGAPLQLDIDTSGAAVPPPNVPLAMITNPRSIYNKLGKLRSWLTNFKPDLCILSEHWGRKGHLEEALSLSPYKAIEYSRGRENFKSRKNEPSKTNATGGGSAIIYNENRFKVEELMVKAPEGVESVFAIVTPKHKGHNNIEKVLVGAVYIAPRSQYKQEAIENIIETMYYAQSLHERPLRHIIAGDVNKTNTSDILDSNGQLKQICSVPTRKTAVLENVFTDLATFYHEPTTLQPLENDEDEVGKPSDHNMLIIAPKVETQFKQDRKRRTIKTMPMPESSIKEFMKDISQHEWKEVYETEDANVKAANFHSTLRSNLQKHFKVKHAKMSKLDKVWFTPGLKHMKSDMLNELFKCGETEKWRQLRTKYRKYRRAAVREHYKQFTDVMRLSDPSKFYKIAKQIGTGRKEEENLRIECIEHLPPKQQVEEVAEAFAKVSQEYEPLNPLLLPSFLPAPPPPQVNMLSVWKAVQNLKKTKSTLEGDLPEKLRKEAAIFLAEPLTDIFNSCLTQGVYPKVWKIETVTPVPKKTEPLLLTDVRKIASTSDFSKIFEKYIKSWIMEDIAGNLSKCQYGGKTGLGTEHAVVNFVDRILKLLDQSSTSSAIIASFVDWRGAFDRQDPTTTINKFIKLGLRSSLIPLLMDYLNDRKMKVKMNGEESELKELIGGSPQGTLLGQLLYIGGSDDAAEEVATENKFKYIDDLEIIELVCLAGALQDYNFSQHIASDVGTHQKFLPSSTYTMQTTLNNLSHWTEENKMAINEEKSNFMIVTRSKTEFKTRLEINSKNLAQVKEAKLLGVYINEDLSWSRNCQEICKKAYSRINMLSRLKYAGMKTKDLVNIYILHIRSLTEYCSTAFHYSLTVEQDRKLESIQRVALKVVLGENYNSYEETLEKTSLTTLYERRQVRCLKFAVKATKHPECREMFPLNKSEVTHNTRDREIFQVNFAHTEAYRRSAIPSLQRLLNSHKDSIHRTAGNL